MLPTTMPKCAICKEQPAHPLYGNGTLCEDCDNDLHAGDAPAVCYRPRFLVRTGDEEE